MTKTTFCILLISFFGAFADSTVFELRAMDPPIVQLEYSPGSLAENPSAELVVTVQIQSGWHINADTVADAFLVPSRIEVEARGLHFGKPVFPNPKKEWVEALQLENLMFQGHFKIRVPITRVEVQYDSTTTNAILHYQACNNFLCLAPGQVRVSLSTLTQSPAADISEKKNISAISEGWIALIFFAFLGGFLLNLMPCVLPVLSLKVLSLVKQSGESRHRLALLGIAMTMGVLVSFWTLGGLVIGLRGAGAGWGFQFQNPAFVAAMTLLLFFLALNLFGVFELWLPGTTQTSLHKATRKEGLLGAFFNGILLTLLSTPCSAPFLGTAMGFAFVQPGPILLLFFSVAGLGLALPYLILSLVPGALRWVPKPGAWMVWFKQFMGFLLVGTAIWLLWILGRQGGTEVLHVVLMALLACGFGAWLIGLAAGPGAPFWRSLLLWVLALGSPVAIWVALGPAALQRARDNTAALIQQGPDAQGWWRYSPQLIEDLQKQGKTIFLDFTADWCITCKANEKGVLERAAIQERFADLDVVPVKADWTRQDSEIGAALRSYGRSGVPLYVIFPGGRPQEPIVLPELLTVDLVLDALEKAGPSVH